MKKNTKVPIKPKIDLDKILQELKKLKKYGKQIDKYYWNKAYDKLQDYNKADHDKKSLRGLKIYI